MCKAQWAAIIAVCAMSALQDGAAAKRVQSNEKEELTTPTDGVRKGLKPLHGGSSGGDRQASGNAEIRRQKKERTDRAMKRRMAAAEATSNPTTVEKKLPAVGKPFWDDAQIRRFNEQNKIDQQDKDRDARARVDRVKQAPIRQANADRVKRLKELREMRRTAALRAAAAKLATEEDKTDTQDNMQIHENSLRDEMQIDRDQQNKDRHALSKKIAMQHDMQTHRFNQQNKVDQQDKDTLHQMELLLEAVPRAARAA